MGPSTYTDDRGNTIDVSGLQKQGYGRLDIADLLGPLGQQIRYRCQHTFNRCIRSIRKYKYKYRHRQR
jgi:hypothetical protein